MFDRSRNQGPSDYFVRAHRVLPEPMPVWVRCDRLFLPRPRSVREVPLWLRAYGVDAGACVPGLLYSWHLLNTGGDFWGLVEFTAGARNSALHLELTELVPESVLSPRAPGEQGPWARGQGGSASNRHPGDAGGPGRG